MSGTVTLHVIQEVLGGLPETPFVAADEATAKAEYDRLMQEHEGEVNPEDGHGDEVDIYWWEVKTA